MKYTRKYLKPAIPTAVFGCLSTTEYATTASRLTLCDGTAVVKVSRQYKRPFIPNLYDTIAYNILK